MKEGVNKMAEIRGVLYYPFLLCSFPIHTLQVLEGSEPEDQAEGVRGMRQYSLGSTHKGELAESWVQP